MRDIIEIKIMLLIGSNGKSSVSVVGDLDWGDLADNIMDWTGNASVDPEATSRHIITVYVPKPAISELPASSVQELT